MYAYLKEHNSLSSPCNSSMLCTAHFWPSCRLQNIWQVENNIDISRLRNAHRSGDGTVTITAAIWIDGRELFLCSSTSMRSSLPCLMSLFWRLRSFGATVSNAIDGVRSNTLDVQFRALSTFVFTHVPITLWLWMLDRRP